MHFDFGPTMSGAVAALVLSAAARALPDPVAGGNAFYAWMFRFAHLLLANFDKTKLPL
jgi:hypothetical protein